MKYSPGSSGRSVKLEMRHQTFKINFAKEPIDQGAMAPRCSHTGLGQRCSRCAYYKPLRRTTDDWSDRDVGCFLAEKLVERFFAVTVLVSVWDSHVQGTEGHGFYTYITSWSDQPSSSLSSTRLRSSRSCTTPRTASPPPHHSLRLQSRPVRIYAPCEWTAFVVFSTRQKSKTLRIATRPSTQRVSDSYRLRRW